VSHLILRSANVRGLCGDAAARLVSLEVLSLSHNCVASLAGFASLCALEELNLNFNQLTSLSALRACARLRKLYVSNNRVRTLDGVRELPQLRTLCLFRNDVHDLAASLDVLRLCPKLRELDLDGNPLARERGYKHHAVKVLLRLDVLDGEPVLPLDRELSREFFESSGGSGPNSRPTTAGATESFDWGLLPKGRVQLFDSDKLNSDPTLLASVANELINDHEDGAPQEAQEPRASFVRRLRRDASRDGVDGPALAAPKTASLDDTPARRQITVKKTPTTNLDASDPYETIRRLIRLVETLQSKVASKQALCDLPPSPDGKAHGRAPADDDSEVGRLKIENRNLHTLRRENADLQQRVKKLEQSENELRASNTGLEAALGAADANLQSAMLQSLTGRVATARPMTAAEVMDEVFDVEGQVDAELEDLFRENEAKLADIRRDVEELSSFDPGAAPGGDGGSAEPLDAAPARDSAPSRDFYAAREAPPSRCASRGGDGLPQTARPGSARPMSSREKRVLSSRCLHRAATPRPPSPPSIADILALRRMDDDEVAAVAAEADVWTAPNGAGNVEGFDDEEDDVCERVVLGKHSWVLWDEDAEAPEDADSAPDGPR